MLEAEQRSPVRTTAAGAAASTTGGADASTKSGTAAEPLTIPTSGPSRRGRIGWPAHCERSAARRRARRRPSSMESHGTTTVYEASSLETVQFISYRADLTGQHQLRSAGEPDGDPDVHGRCDRTAATSGCHRIRASRVRTEVARSTESGQTRSRPAVPGGGRRVRLTSAAGGAVFFKAAPIPATKAAGGRDRRRIARRPEQTARAGSLRARSGGAHRETGPRSAARRVELARTAPDDGGPARQRDTLEPLRIVVAVVGLADDERDARGGRSGSACAARAGSGSRAARCRPRSSAYATIEARGCPSSSVASAAHRCDRMRTAASRVMADISPTTRSRRPRVCAQLSTPNIQLPASSGGRPCFARWELELGVGTLMGGEYRGASQREASFALSVMFTAASAFEMGQPALAFCACSRNAASFMPGTAPSVSRSMRVIPNPSACFSRCDLGGRPNVLGGRPGLREHVRKRHGETGRVGGADQFFGIGAAAVLEPRPEIIGTGERAASELDPPRPVRQRATPFGLCSTCWHSVLLDRCVRRTSLLDRRSASCSCLRLCFSAGEADAAFAGRCSSRSAHGATRVQPLMRITSPSDRLRLG